MKTLALTILTGLLCLSMYAQEQKKHEKRLYTAPDGKLYINRDLPVYVWLSTSPEENSKKTRLQSEDSKKYTNPMYFDTEGLNTVRTPSKVDTVSKKTIYPLEDIIFEIYVDSRSPHTYSKLVETNTFEKGKTTFCNGSVKLVLRENDELSGTENTFVSIDGVPFSPYKDTLSFTSEKEYLVKYYSVDNVGNAEETRSISFTIDKAPPTTEMILEGDVHENILSGKSKISFKSTDKVSGIKHIKYSFNGHAEKEYTYPISTEWLSEGEHTITFYAEDFVGNKETLQTKSIFVDKTAPMVLDELVGNTYFVNGKEYSSGATQMKLTAMDNKAGIKEIKYTVDGKNYETYTAPFKLPSNSGLLSISYYATDNVNNKSTANQESGKGKTAYVDLSGPELSFHFTGKTFTSRDTVFITNGTAITLKATDDGAGAKGIRYKINKGSETEFTEPIVFDKEGRYSVSYTGFDNVNNSNQSEFYFIVDTRGPQIFERFGIEKVGTKDGLDLYPAHTVVFLSATDIDVGYDRMYYSINGAEAVRYTDIISGFKKNTKYTIKVKAYDNLKNFTESEFSFYTAD